MASGEKRHEYALPWLAGQQALLANHGSLWPKQLDQALAKNRCASSPLSDPDSQFTPFQVEGEAAAQTLILMEFADVGSLDHDAVRARFRRNLVRLPPPPTPPLASFALVTMHVKAAQSRSAQVARPVGSAVPV